MPRIAVIVAAVALGSLFTAGLLPGAAVQDAPPASAGAGFVGAWLAAPPGVDEAVAALVTFSSDGTVVVSNRPPEPADGTPTASPVVQSLGHGAWVATGEATVDVVVVFLQTDPAGTDLGVRFVSGSLTLDADGSAWSGSFDITVADASGTDVQTGVELSALRIGSAPTASIATPAAATPIAGSRDAVDVTGLVEQPLHLTVADLQAMPAASVTTTWTDDGGASAARSFRGVPLAAVFDRARPRFGPERDAPGSAYVVATGSDGYEAVVAWGELAPAASAAPILLAWEEDGQPLPPEHRPAYLIVPGDIGAARSVWAVVRLELRDVDSPPRG